MTRPTQLKLGAYLVLLTTLFLPFSRCTRSTPTPPTPPTNETAGAGERENVPPENAAAATENAPVSTPDAEAAAANSAETPPSVSPSPWYHVFGRNGDNYGMDLFVASWFLPTELPKEFGPEWFVPGRMFYVWPLAMLALAIRWPPRMWRRKFHALEIVLGLGSMYWVMLLTLGDTLLYGFYIAETALGFYVAVVLYELVAEWRRARKGVPPPRAGAAEKA